MILIKILLIAKPTLHNRIHQLTVIFPFFWLPILFFVYTLNLDGFIQSFSLNTMYMVVFPNIISSPDIPQDFRFKFRMANLTS